MPWFRIPKIGDAWEQELSMKDCFLKEATNWLQVIYLQNYISIIKEVPSVKSNIKGYKKTTVSASNLAGTERNSSLYVQILMQNQMIRCTAGWLVYFELPETKDSNMESER